MFAVSFRVRTCGGDAHPGAALRHPCRGARARFSCVWTRPNPCAEALVALGHACAQLKNAWAAIEKMPADARRAAIAAYELPRKGGAKSSIKIFSDDEEEILVSFCNMAAVTTVAVACSPCRDAPACHDCDRNHQIGQRRVCAVHGSQEVVPHTSQHDSCTV